MVVVAVFEGDMVVMVLFVFGEVVMGRFGSVDVGYDFVGGIGDGFGSDYSDFNGV